jgi:RNA polymerase sigma-70 factor (family 1)
MATPKQAGPETPPTKVLPRSATARRGDVELCARLAAGDEAAFAELFEREWSHLVSYAENFAADLDMAEEAVQAAFVRLWRRRRRLDPAGSVRALLFQTTRNLCIDQGRKRRTRRQVRDQLKRLRRPPATPFERLRERELRGAMEEAVGELSPRRREAFMLCRVHGLGHREAAEVMELSPQTVSNHVTAALKHIRTALTPQME